MVEKVLGLSAFVTLADLEVIHRERTEWKEGKEEEEGTHARRACRCELCESRLCKRRFLAVQYCVDVTTTTKCNRVRDKIRKRKKKNEKRRK